MFEKYGFNPLNQVYRLNIMVMGLISMIILKRFNPLNQVYRLNIQILE